MLKFTVVFLLPLLAMLLFISIPVFIQANSAVSPVGTTIYKPDKCWNGYTILSGEDGRLVDMNGNLAHLWKGPFGMPSKVLPGGHLLVSRGFWKPGSQDASEIQIRDFANEVLWKFNRWQEDTSNVGAGNIWVARQHHDIQIKGNC